MPFVDDRDSLAKNLQQHLDAAGLSYMDGDISELERILQQEFPVSQPLAFVDNVIKEVKMSGEYTTLLQKMRLLTNGMTAPVDSWKTNKQNLYTSLQNHANAVHTEVQSLTTTLGFEGEAATQAQQSSKTLLGYADMLSTELNDSMKADTKLLTDIDTALTDTATHLSDPGAQFLTIVMIEGMITLQTLSDSPDNYFVTLAESTSHPQVHSVLSHTVDTMSTAINNWENGQKELQKLVFPKGTTYLPMAAGAGGPNYHDPGGPYHPPEGTQLSCSSTDSCSSISTKMNYLKHTIDKHQQWDDTHPPDPRYPGGRHKSEIDDFKRALSKCVVIHQAKCVKQPEVHHAPAVSIDFWTVFHILVILGISVGLIATIIVALADPEPISKLASIGLSIEEVNGLLAALAL